MQDPAELKTRDDVDRSLAKTDEILDKVHTLRIQLGIEKRQRKARRSYGHKPLTAFGLEVN